MSAVGARLFAWVQGAPFYENVHRAAVELLPDGHGRTWLDVGCGPGLVTRMARDRGYDAVGLDVDANMVRAAQQHPESHGCRFVEGGFSDAVQLGGDVVSAASLLFVVPDPAEALAALWAAVRPDGVLLVVETTTRMTPANARAVLRRVLPGRRTALRMWAHTRRGRAIEPSVFDTIDAIRTERHELLDGLVEARIYHRGGA